MSSIQLERLKNDSQKLGHFIAKQRKRGNADRVHKLAKKQAFLDQTIAEFSRV